MDSNSVQARLQTLQLARNRAELINKFGGQWDGDEDFQGAEPDRARFIDAELYRAKRGRDGYHSLDSDELARLRKKGATLAEPTAEDLFGSDEARGLAAAESSVRNSLISRAEAAWRGDRRVMNRNKLTDWVNGVLRVAGLADMSSDEVTVLNGGAAAESRTGAPDDSVRVMNVVGAGEMSRRTAVRLRRVWNPNTIAAMAAAGSFRDADEMESYMKETNPGL